MISNKDFVLAGVKFLGEVLVVKAQKFLIVWFEAKVSVVKNLIVGEVAEHFEKIFRSESVGVVGEEFGIFVHDGLTSGVGYILDVVIVIIESGAVNFCEGTKFRDGDLTDFFVLNENN